MAERFGRNAQEIERTDGCAGWCCSTGWTSRRSSFTRSIPTNSAACATLLGGDAAADLLLHWREYFGLKRADDTDRSILIAQIANLTPAQQQAAARYPGACCRSDPGGSAGMTGLVERMTGDERRSPTRWPSFASSASSQGPRTCSRPCKRSNDTDRSPSKHSAGQGPKGSPSVSL